MAKEAADAPRLLLLYGPPGVGKTHLLQAILNFSAARRSQASEIHLCADELVQQWIAALKGDPEAALPRRLERSALVAIDDLHVLAGEADHATRGRTDPRRYGRPRRARSVSWDARR